MKKKNIPAAILLVVGMFVIAEYIENKEIIFPEISALALGAWVMEKTSWGNNPLHFWVSPTLAALTGWAIMNFFPYTPFLMIAVAFILVVIQLELIGSSVFPSFSAAILPIILHSDSWYYPLSVCILTLIIAVDKKIMNDIDRKKIASDGVPNNAQGKCENEKPREGFIFWVKLLIGIMLVSALALGFDAIYMITPPLFVLFVEMSRTNSPLPAKAGLVFILVVTAAFSGVFWLYLIYNILHWPVWIAAGLATAWVFLLFHCIRLPFPPAAAITLVPMIIPMESIGMYPWHVLLGSASFIIISLLLFQRPQLPTIKHLG